MIEATIINHLSDALEVPVSMEREGQTAPFVLIERTGGSRTNRINTATIAVQSYGKSLLKACELNEAVKEAVYNLTELDAICSVGLNSDYNFTDTTTKDYRYQALFNIYYLMEE